MDKKEIENKVEKKQSLVAKKDFECIYGNNKSLRLKKGDVISNKLPKELINNLKIEGVL